MVNIKIVNILHVPFIKATFSQFTNQLENRIENHKNTFVVTANPEIVMYANAHKKYLNLIQHADYITADGIGIIKASQMINNPLPQRVTGYDIFKELLNWGDFKRKSIYLLGSHTNVIKDSIKKIKKLYPHLRICGYHNGYFKNPQSILKQIKQTHPDMIFIAMGYPKQEEFINHYRNLSNSLWMGIGGSLDVFSGHLKRAPKIWINHHLEWLYRLIKQPTRFSRMLALPKFVLAIKKQEHMSK